MNIFTAVKYCCILHERVCVMTHLSSSALRSQLADCITKCSNILVDKNVRSSATKHLVYFKLTNDIVCFEKPVPGHVISTFEANMLHLYILFEPRHEKTCLRGVRPGPTQAGLYG